LNNHPNVVVPPESFFLVELYTKYHSKKNWSNDLKESFVADLWLDSNFRKVWQVDKKDLRDAIFNSKINDYNDACLAVKTSYQRAFENKKLHCVGDKKPYYAREMRRVLKVHPKTKIIHLIRDPRGTANGRKNTFKKKGVILSAIIWNRLNKNIKRFSPRNRRLVVRYEDLVSNPSSELKKICGFLNIPFQESMLHYLKTTKKEYSNVPEEVKKKHQSLLKPINSSMIEKWKSGLSEKEQLDIAYYTGKQASEYGYNLPKVKYNMIRSLRSIPFRFKFHLVTFISKTFLRTPFWIRKMLFKVQGRYKSIS
jgi:hypothetical protein